MKKSFFCTLVAVTGVFALAGCGGSTTNSNTNSNRSAVNSAVNTVANAANTVANTVSNTAAKITTADADTFLKDAAEGGMTEVELGRIAAANSQNAEIKKFGQMMVVDHGKANTEIKALAAKKNITLPADASANKSTIDKMKGLKGAEFDKDYVAEMVDGHESTVAAFQKQADNAADPDVKAFAAKTLPVLKKHLEEIKAIQAKMK